MSARPGKKGQEEPLSAQPITLDDGERETTSAGGLAQPSAEPVEPSAELTELRAMLRAQGDQVAALELRLEQLVEAVEVLERAVASSATKVMSAEQFEAAVKGGHREFVVAADCRHTRIHMRAGTVMDPRDYDVPMLMDLIKHGRLQLRPKAS